MQSDPTIKNLRNHPLGDLILIESDYLQSGAMIDTLAARVKIANKQIPDAFKLYQAALKTYPQHRALIYDYAAALLSHQGPQAALNFINK